MSRFFLCQEHFKFDHMVPEKKNITVDITVNKQQSLNKQILIRKAYLALCSGAPRREITFFKQITLSDKT